MPATPDYYTMLGVHPKASDEVVKAAYRALVKKYNGDTKRLQQLNDANEVLSDAKKKAEYDKARVKPPGKVIGPYRILEKIAEGGFGSTYKAENIVLGTPVCIKHALNVSATDEAILLDEARTIWDMRHWGIPAMRDILRMPDDSLALVMSYVPGPTLAQIVEKHPEGMDPEHVAWIAERCLNTLKYLHMHGVVHGDMKPQNVIVQTESHTVTVVDYGLAHVRPSSDGESKGYTPYFAAPEQIEGTSPIIPQTDLYGLGMTMIFALGGDVAHVKVPSTTPANMVSFIKKLIRRDPLQRPDVWQKEDLCESIKTVREKDFGRTASGMKPLNV